MIETVAFDTNILIYSIDLRDREKHRISRRIVRACSSADNVVALQCLAEFYRAATSKRLLPLPIARAVVDETRASMRVVAASELDLIAAMETHAANRVSFFDALIASVLIGAGCTTLFSEDFHHGQTISGLKVLNPFVLTESELDALLAG